MTRATGDSVEQQKSVAASSNITALCSLPVPWLGESKRQPVRQRGSLTRLLELLRLLDVVFVVRVRAMRAAVLLQSQG